MDGTVRTSRHVIPGFRKRNTVDGGKVAQSSLQGYSETMACIDVLNQKPIILIFLTGT